MAPPNPPFTTRVCASSQAGIEEAVRLIRRGLPVAVPTETVYGLAADATNGEAIARVYEAKGRPAFNPLIVHVLSEQQAEPFAEFSPVARGLAERFWPGPLTMVLPLKPNSGIASLVTAGLSTIAVRVPAHPVMRDLLAAAAVPLAAPSANPSGRISPTRAEHVASGLAGRIPLILDAGPTTHGLESTILAVEGDEVRLLRAGPVTQTGYEIVTTRSEKIEAPGQLASHYAPSKPLRLDAVERKAGEWLIGFDAVAGDRNLSCSGDLVEAAANLFDSLHEAEAQPCSAIAVAPIPRTGLGIAIYDRLNRAAAPR